MSVIAWSGARQCVSRDSYVHDRRITRTLLWTGTALRLCWQWPGDIGATRTVPTTDEPTTPFRSVLAANLNFDSLPSPSDYTAYRDSVVRRIADRMVDYREGFSTAVALGSNPSAPSYLTDSLADMRAVNVDVGLCLNVYPANSAGLPGTWQLTPMFTAAGATAGHIDRDGICLSQARASAGNLTMSGVFVASGTVTWAATRLVSLYSAGNLSAVDVTVDGTNHWGETKSVTVKGPNAGTVNVAGFKTVTRVAVGAAIGAAIEVGTSAVLNGTWVDAETALNAQAAYTLSATETAVATWLETVQWAALKKVEKTGAKFIVGQNEKNNPFIGSGLNEGNVGFTAAAAGTRSVSAYEVAIRDFPLTMRYCTAARTLAMKRHTALIKAIAEARDGIGLSTAAAALRAGITHTWYFLDGVLPEQRFFGNYTGGQEWSVSASGFPWGYNDWNAVWSAEWQKHLDGLAVNKHRDLSKNTDFDGAEITAPDTQSTDGNYVGNAWMAQDRAIALNGGARVPVYITESGQSFGGIDPNSYAGSSDGGANGTWGVETGDAGVVIYPEQRVNRAGRLQYVCSLTAGRDALLRHRAAMFWVGHLWYGPARVVHYSHCFSSSYGNNHSDSRPGTESVWEEADGGDGLRFKPFPFWVATHRQFTDPQSFDVREMSRQFPQKTWEEFWDLRTWAPFINMVREPTGAPLTEPPYLPWQNYSFGQGSVPAGVVEMTPWASATYPGHTNSKFERMMIAQPIWLPWPDKLYRVELDILFPDAAATATSKAKLEVRGYNKRNGLARAFEVVSGGVTSAGGGTGPGNWKRLGVEFTHVGHGLDAPEANYALITAQFNNLGTYPVQFRNPDVMW